MAKFLLFVTSSPDDQAAYSALEFAKEVIKQEHQLLAVFFYSQGVMAANTLQAPPSDETNITDAWCALAENTQLLVCSAAAQRRGVLDKEEAQYHGKHSFNMNKPFKIAGLGEYVSLQADADKVIQF